MVTHSWVRIPLLPYLNTSKIYKFVLAFILMVSHHTLKQLFSAKLFLGGFAQRFNPDSTPYLQGRRHQIYILDLIHSNFRIRKLLSFVETAVRRRVNVLFVLRKGWVFGPSLTPFTSYVQYYTGGVLSNFSAVLRHYKTASVAHYVPEFPVLSAFLLNTLCGQLRR
jgi:ribosomal protein S2